MPVAARAEERDRVQAFKHGADDGLVNPCYMRELELRVRPLLRRTKGRDRSDFSRKQRIGESAADFAAHALTRGHEQHGLLKQELDLLRFLMVHEGRTLDRTTLLDSVWGRDEDPTPRTVDMHVLRSSNPPRRSRCTSSPSAARAIAFAPWQRFRQRNRRVDNPLTISCSSLTGWRAFTRLIRRKTRIHPLAPRKNQR